MPSIPGMFVDRRLGTRHPGRPHVATLAGPTQPALRDDVRLLRAQPGDTLQPVRWVKKHCLVSTGDVSPFRFIPGLLRLTCPPLAAASAGSGARDEKACSPRLGGSPSFPSDRKVTKE